MFRFLKTKKGFSLVELMIVVVIMAILVAVAVPIYNGIADNARAKTCIDNQRTLITTVNNHISLYGVQREVGTVTFSTNNDERGYISAHTGISETFYNKIVSLFNVVPCCPVQGGELVLTISLKDGSIDSYATAKCVNGGEKHVLVEEND